MIILFAMAGEVRADKPIRYRALEGCPDAEWLDARIKRYLGREPTGVKASVVIRKRGEGWTVTVTTRTVAGEGEVTHHGTQCQLLVDAAALIIAIAIDPAAGTQSGVPDQEPAPPEPPVRSSPPPSWGMTDDEIPPIVNRPGDELPTRPVESWWLGISKPYASVRLMVGSDVGSLPDVEPGAGLAITGHVGRVWIDWSLLGFASSRAELDAMEGVGSEFRLLSSTLRGCLLLVKKLGAWSGCTTVEAGRLSARPYGVGGTIDRDQVWWSFGGALSASWSILKTLDIRVDVEGARNARRYQFELLDLGLFQPAVVHWRSFVGLERRF